MFDFSYANILHSNIINFLIMLVMIGVIIKRLDVKGMLDSRHKKTVETINKSSEDVKKALAKYEKAKEELDNTHYETEKIVSDAKNLLNHLEQSAHDELNEIKNHYDKNMEKEVERAKQNAYNDISSSIAKASSALSYENIKQTLKHNPQLHQKYIDECIDSIDGLSI